MEKDPRPGSGPESGTLGARRLTDDEALRLGNWGETAALIGLACPGPDCTNALLLDVASTCRLTLASKPSTWQSSMKAAVPEAAPDADRPQAATFIRNDDGSPLRVWPTPESELPVAS